MSKNKDGTVNLVDKTSATGEWYTPELVLSPVRRYFGGRIPLDPCTRADNPTAARVFYTPRTNGLARDWSRYDGVFINPPYGKEHGFHAFLEKIAEEAAKETVILVLLSCGSGRPGTKYWQKDILTQYYNAVCWIKGRVAFLLEDGMPVKSNTYPSHILGYNVDAERFGNCFDHLGACYELKKL